MPTVRWPLEAGGAERLEAVWRGTLIDPYADFALRLDDAPLFTAAGSKELRTGKSAELPDGAGTITATVKNGLLHFTRGGDPLPWEDRTEEARHEAAIAVWFVGIVNVGMGLYAVLTSAPGLQRMGFGWPAVLLGVVFLALGIATYRNSLPALSAAAVLFASDFVMTIVGLIGGAPGNLGLIIIRLLLLGYMTRGIMKLWKARGN
jgi:hypothetical protein